MREQVINERVLKRPYLKSVLYYVFYFVFLKYLRVVIMVLLNMTAGCVYLKNSNK